MANPFLTENTATASHLREGDTRTVLVRDKDGSVTKTVNIHRTSRPYVNDVVDAYNMARSRQDIEWIIGADGNPHMQFLQAPKKLTEAMEARNEADRQKWAHRHNHPERYV